MKETHFPTSSPLVLIRLDPSSFRALLPLEVGQVLRGEVLEVTDGEHAILRLNGYPLRVETRIPLEKGMGGRFEVTSLHPHLLLKFLPEEEEIVPSEGMRGWASLLRALSSEEVSLRLNRAWKLVRENAPIHIRETMDRLWRLGRSTAPMGSGPIDPSQIERAIGQSGLFFETLLGRWIREGKSNRIDEGLYHDLKGLLVRLKSQLIREGQGDRLSSLGSEELKDLLEGVDHLLKRIDLYQQLSASTFKTEGKIFLLLPFWLGDQLQFVDLQLSLPRRDPETPEDHGGTIRFLLHVPEWGRLSIEIQTIGSRLLGRCFFSREEVAAFFRENLPDLQERLVRLGFQPEIQVATQRPEKILEHFMAEIKGSEKPLLDLLV